MVEQDFYFDDGVQRLDFIPTIDADFITNTEGAAVGLRQSLENFIVDNDPDFVNALPGSNVIDDIQEALSNGLQEFDASANPIPRDFDIFITAWIDNMDIDPPLQSSTLVAALVRFFERKVGLTSTTTGAQLPGLGEWAPLGGSSLPIVGKSLFDEAFAEFVRTFPYGEQGTVADLDAFPGVNSAYRNFTINLGRFLINTARLKEDPVPDSELSTPQGLNLISYETIYKTFFPDDPDGFEPLIQEFAEKKFAEDGFFLPSHAVDDWIEEVKRRFLSGPEGLLDAPFLTSVSGNNSEKVSIINRIIRLVSDLVEVLQRVAATQAKQLDILTELQKTYTEIQSQIPAITAGTASIGHEINTPPDDDDEDRAERDAGFRQDVNTNISQRVIETIRGQKQLQENKAKKVQSFINQANDAVNQQAEIATTLLQQLSSLLQAIYR